MRLAITNANDFFVAGNWRVDAPFEGLFLVAIELVSISSITVLKDLLARTKIDRAFVTRLKMGLHLEGMEPILLFKVSDTDLVLVDGLHRYDAAARTQKNQVNARVLSLVGKFDDWRLLVRLASFTRNRRTLSRRDKRRMLRWLFTERGWFNRSNAYLSRFAGLTRKPIQSERAKLELEELIPRTARRTVRRNRLSFSMRVSGF